MYSVIQYQESMLKRRHQFSMLWTQPSHSALKLRMWNESGTNTWGSQQFKVLTLTFNLVLEGYLSS